MGIGAGLIEGTAVDASVGTRPDDEAYDGHSGATYHPQDEGGTGNVGFYEINNTSDEINFALGPALRGISDPVLVFYTAFGTTDFDIINRNTNATLVSEQSGFDTDVWLVDAPPTTDQLRITQFDTGTVNGTQAGWYPFVGVFDLK